MTDMATWINTTFAGFDHSLLQALHSLAEWGGAFFTPFLWAVSYVGELGAIVIVLAVFLIFFKQTRKAGICMILAVCLGALMTNVLIKEFVARPRPFADSVEMYNQWWAYVGSYPTSEIYSFPSGHVTATMAGMMALFLSLDKRITWVGFVFVAIMGVSRCYFMVHYPSDVLGGVLVGALAGVLAYLIVQAIAKRKDPKESDETSLDVPIKKERSI